MKTPRLILERDPEQSEALGPAEIRHLPSTGKPGKQSCLSPASGVAPKAGTPMFARSGGQARPHMRMSR